MLAAVGASLSLAAATLVPIGAAQAVEVGARSVGFVGGSGHAELYGWGVAATEDSVLIGDYWNWRVREFSLDGTLLSDVIDNEGYGEDQTQSPYGLAWEPGTGAIYVADTDRRRVVKFDADGNYLFKTGVNNKSGAGPNIFKYPSRVAVASTGEFAVIDTWDQRVSVHDGSTGQELYDFGGFGAGPGQFKGPHGAAFDNQDRLYVADSRNYRVQVLEKDGTPLYSFGSQGKDPGQFVGDIRGLCIDTANEWLYVVDAAGNRVSKFGLDGTYLTQWGSKGTGDGQFIDGGRECAVDANSDVWVGDMPNFRAQKFSSNGDFLLAVPAAPSPPPVGGLNGPRGVAVDSTGAVIVADTYNWRMQKFSPSGAADWSFGVRGRGDYAFNYVRLVDADPRNDDFVLADTDNQQIKKYNAQGQLVWRVGEQGTAAGQFKNPHAVSVRSDGLIAVTDTNNDRVVILAEDGTVVRTFGSSGGGNGQFKFPRGIAWGDNNTIWVADSGRDDLQQFTETGEFLQAVGKGTVSNPFDLAIGNGYIFVADTGSHSVTILDFAGTYIGSFGGYGTGPGQMIKPQGLDIYGTNVYVAEQGNDRVQVFSLELLGAEPPVPDDQAPQLVVDSPAGNQVFDVGPVVVAGSATDNIGVDRVVVAIKDKATNQWLQSDGSWGAWSTRQRDAMLSAPGATASDWSFSFANGAVGNYGVQIEALDARGNSSGQAWLNFSLQVASTDAEAPTLTVVPLANDGVFLGGPVTLTGTASDNVGVENVFVAIKDKATNLWLQSDGTWGSWGGRQRSAVLGSPGGTSTDWEYAFASDVVGDYSAQVEALDAAGNSSGRQLMDFSIRAANGDLVAPEVTIDSPTANQVFSGTSAALSGSATDNVGVSGVLVAVQDRMTGLWWQADGSWGPFGTRQQQAVLGTPGSAASAWSYTFDPGATGVFGLQVEAVDASANSSGRQWRPFEIA